MRVHLCRPDELGADDIAAWQSMQRASSSLSNPFLSPEFTIAVGRLRPDARVAVLYDGPSFAGFFPFERGRFGGGTPICSWPGALCQGLVHAPGFEWDPRELLRQCDLAAWQFDHLVDGQEPFKHYREATIPSPVIDLSDGFGSYYAKAQVSSPRFCRDIARRARSLERDNGDLRYVAYSDDTELLRTLMSWKSAQYRRMGVIDRFNQPWFVELIDALHAARTEHFDGMLSAIYAGDQPVAAQFGLRCLGSFAGWFTAYDPRFGKYSPGLIQLMQMAEGLAAAGVRLIDLGEGSAAYKEKLKSYDVYVSQGIVSGRSTLAMAHRARTAAAVWVGRTAFQHPRLYHATYRVRNALLRK